MNTGPLQKVLRRRNASWASFSAPDCINKIMMSHLTLHPESEANYLCLYCLMTEALTGPLRPAGTETDLSQAASSRPWVCHSTEAIHQAGTHPCQALRVSSCPPPTSLAGSGLLNPMIPIPLAISWT